MSAAAGRQARRSPATTSPPGCSPHPARLHRRGDRPGPDGHHGGAGHQPTADWIGNSLRLMLTDDRFAASLSGGRHSVAEAMNEVLWEDTPDAELRRPLGRRATPSSAASASARGDLLLLGLAARQRRPAGPHRTAPALHRRQQRPLLLRPRRAPLPVPGAGDRRGHRPYGHRGAAGPAAGRRPRREPEELTWRPSPWLRGLDALPVTFTPTTALNQRG